MTAISPAPGPEAPGYGAGFTLAGDGAIAVRPIRAYAQRSPMRTISSLFRAAAAAFSFLLVAPLSACTGESPSPSPSSTLPAALDTLDYAMRSFMDQGANAVVAQVRWPEGEWSKAYGVRSLDTKQPAQPDDLVLIASVTKSMTAVSVLKLVEDGLIGLDDPVNGVLESFRTVLKPPAPITVRQLLSHTSGMPRYHDALVKTVDDIVPALSQRMSLQRGLELTGTLPWEARSVGLVNYSDSNYLALGQLLEQFRGKPYPDVLRDDVIKPLGLTRTTIDEIRGAPDLIHGYITIRGERVDGSQTEDQIGSPSHGVASTMSEVNDFFSALFQGRLISANSLEEMKKTNSTPFGLGIIQWSEDCTGAHRYGGRGGFWDYRTVAMSSADGRYQATMTMVPGPIPSPLEDPQSENKHNLWSGQITSALQESLDRLCE